MKKIEERTLKEKNWVDLLERKELLGSNEIELRSAW